MTYNPFSLSGKTVLITGAASGIGRATAESKSLFTAGCGKCHLAVIFSCKNT